jgi:hypothetical protein
VDPFERTLTVERAVLSRMVPPATSRRSAGPPYAAVRRATVWRRILEPKLSPSSSCRTAGTRTALSWLMRQQVACRSAVSTRLDRTSLARVTCPPTRTRVSSIFGRSAAWPSGHRDADAGDPARSSNRAPGTHGRAQRGTSDALMLPAEDLVRGEQRQFQVGQHAPAAIQSDSGLGSNIPRLSQVHGRTTSSSRTLALQSRAHGRALPPGRWRWQAERCGG